MRWERASGRAGARVIGSLRPDDSMDGVLTALITGRNSSRSGRPRSARAARLPGLIAGQIAWIHQTVFDAVGREMVVGRNPGEISREVLVLLGGIEERLGDKVLNYAVRGQQ